MWKRFFSKKILLQKNTYDPSVRPEHDGARCAKKIFQQKNICWALACRNRSPIEILLSVLTKRKSNWDTALVERDFLPMAQINFFLEKKLIF
jgi:hypothetical protein